MNRKDIYVIKGQELEALLESLKMTKVWKLSVTVEDGVKIKVNERIWSPPMGTSLEEVES